MRIVFISPHSDPLANLGEPDAGGQCVYENELAISLAQKGFEVVTFCRQRNDHEPIEEVVPGYTVYRIRAGGMGFIPKEIIERTLPEFTAKAHQILTSLTPADKTILHGHYWDGAATALMYKFHYPDYPMVWTPHSLGYIKRDKFKGIKPEMQYHFIPRLTWENYGTMVANAIIVSTKDEKRKIIRAYASVSRRVHVIPPGVSFGTTEFREKYKAKWGIADGAKILLVVGRISRVKGYHHAIHVLSELNKVESDPWKLVIVGGASHISSPEEAKYFRDLRYIAKKLGVLDKIIFQPSVPHHEIQSIYSLASIYLMTSEEEPFGLTTIEAMASGLPVIAHDEGGSKNIVSNNVTGYLVNMRRYHQVAEFVHNLLKNPIKLKRLGERAQAHVHENYSWECRIPYFVDIYRAVSQIIPNRLNRVLRNDAFLQRNLSFV